MPTGNWWAAKELASVRSSPRQLKETCVLVQKGIGRAGGWEARLIRVLTLPPCCSVLLCSQIPDYQQLDLLLEKKGSVLVVGGGFLGTELAVGIASRCEGDSVHVSW